MYQSLLARGRSWRSHAPGISSKCVRGAASCHRKEAVQLASARIGRCECRLGNENEQQKPGERSAYFPSLSNQSNVIHITDLQISVFPPHVVRLGGRGARHNVTQSKARHHLFHGTMMSSP